MMTRKFILPCLLCFAYSCNLKNKSTNLSDGTPLEMDVFIKEDTLVDFYFDSCTVPMNLWLDSNYRDAKKVCRCKKLHDSLLLLNKLSSESEYLNSAFEYVQWKFNGEEESFYKTLYHLEKYINNTKSFPSDSLECSLRMLKCKIIYESDSLDLFLKEGLFTWDSIGCKDPTIFFPLISRLNYSKDYFNLSRLGIYGMREGILQKNNKHINTYILNSFIHLKQKTNACSFVEKGYQFNSNLFNQIDCN